MIIPIGHQETSVRRLPWVTLSLIALCFLAFLGTDTSVEAEPTDWLAEAADYWRGHAYLEAEQAIRDEVAYDVMPNQRQNYLQTLPNLVQQPLDPRVIAAEQAELDRLTDLALLRSVSEEEVRSPFARFGLVPKDLRPHTFITSMFMHGDWLHLLGNMFLLFLVGPPLEDRWGRATFLGVYALCGVLAGAIDVALSLEAAQHVPRVGASGAIAGLMGGFLIRLWKTQIRFFYFFMFGLRMLTGTFEAPAWAMLPLWFGNEVFQAWLWDSMGMVSGIAYWAHAGGFAVGLGCAALVRQLRIEERFIDPAVEQQLTRFSANPVLQEAMDLREQGCVGQALELLAAEFEREPSDELALPFWDAALACQQPERAGAAMVLAIRTAARRAELELAVRHWSELSDQLPTVLVDPAVLLRFVPFLAEEGQHDRVKLALRQAVHPENTPLTVGQALRAVELAREADPESALRAAQVALASTDLHEAKRESLLELVRELESAGASAAPPEASLESLEPPPEGTPWDEDGLISLGRFGSAKLSEARPTGLSQHGLRIALSQEQAAEIAWARIEAVSVAVIEDMGPRPVLLIDLLANWSEVEAPELEGVRLRSDAFDPRPLVPNAPDATRAFLAIAAAILERSGATPLPSREATRGSPFARYPTLTQYEAEVLNVA